jgi:hypothetical protein
LQTFFAIFGYKAFRGHTQIILYFLSHLATKQ